MARIGAKIAVITSLAASTALATPSTTSPRIASLSVGMSGASGTDSYSETKREVPDVTESKLEKLGPLMNEIGVEAAEIVGGDPDGLYIFAEVEPGTIFSAVFKDEGTSVRYYDPTDALEELIYQAWELESANGLMRWTVMEYEVRGTKFDVKLIYPEELNPDEDSADRRRAGLYRRFGDKPVIYPSMPEHFQELKSE